MDMAQMIVSGTKIHRPLMDKTVTTEDWEKARKELNETPETRKALLTKFKEMLLEEKDFLVRTDEMYLLRFLRVKKFELERADKLLKDHYQFRAEHPDCFPAPSTIERVLRANIFNYLPHRDHMGRAIFLVKMRNWDPSEIVYRDFVAAGNIVSEYVLDNSVTQINGYIGIWDFSGFSCKHSIPFCSKENVDLLAKLIQDSFPGRLKFAYCVNTHYLVRMAWALFSLLLREKFKKRVKLLGNDMRELHQFVDPCILPEEYGGIMPSWPCNEIVQRVMDKDEYFKENRRFGFQGKK